MGLRSHQIHEIRLALRERDLFVNIDSVVDLKKLFPALKCRKLDTRGLAIVLEEIPTADLNAWQNPPKPTRKAQPLEKCLLSRVEIQELKQSGKSLSDIAQIAGVSRERIRQLLASVKL